MDQIVDKSTLYYFAEICVNNKISWNHNGKKYADKDGIIMIFKDLTLVRIYNCVFASTGIDPALKNFILTSLTNVGIKNDINKLSKEVGEMKDDIKNLNDKLAVLIDALTTIDQKITKS